MDTISLSVGATIQRLYTLNKIVRSAVIQNISTENVTLFNYGQGTAAQGVILNAASAAGEAGGQAVLEKDPTGQRIYNLYDIFFVRTTAGVTLSVAYEKA